MPVKFDTVRAEEQSATTQRVIGKIVLTSDKAIKDQIFGLLMETSKESTPRANDTMRIAAGENVDLPDIYIKRQQELLRADAELVAKQQQSAAESRKVAAERRRLQKEQEAREAADREEFEAWRRANRPTLPPKRFRDGGDMHQ